MPAPIIHKNNYVDVNPLLRNSTDEMEAILEKELKIRDEEEKK